MNLNELETRARGLFSDRHKPYSDWMQPYPDEKTACPLLLYTQQLCTNPIKVVFVGHNWANMKGNRGYTQARNVGWAEKVYKGKILLKDEPTLYPLFHAPWSRTYFERGETVALNDLVGLTKLPTMSGLIDDGRVYRIAMEHWLLPLLLEWHPAEVFLLGKWALKEFVLNGHRTNTYQHLDRSLRSIKVEPTCHSSQDDWWKWPELRGQSLL
jgi:hypothetical protein